jgi:hypothetical protein
MIPLVSVKDFSSQALQAKDSGPRAATHQGLTKRNDSNHADAQQ